MTMKDNRVVWSEGLFLQPHHLQQQERWLEHLLQCKMRPLRLFPWGIETIELDTGLLSNGIIAVVSAGGTLPDGTAFRMPEHDPVPTPIQLDETVERQTVYLAVPLVVSGEAQVELASGEAPGARYWAEDAVVRDANSGERVETTLRIGRLRTRLMLESDSRDGYANMGIAQVVECRGDGTIILDRNYIPPCLDCRASVRLSRWLEELLTSLHRHGDELARRVGTPSTDSLSSFGNFMFLLTVNRLEPLVAHLNSLTGLHPEDLYRELLPIAGELSTFTDSRRTPQFPRYRHDDLAGTFEPVIRALRKFPIPAEPALQIDIEDRPRGYKVAILKDPGLLSEAMFVLGAKANMGRESLRRQFPDQVKVGPVEELQRLVAHALPAIQLMPMDGPPREIPPKTGATYFELDRGSEYWQPLSNSGAFAMLVPDKFPGLELEFWAIRGRR